MPELAEQVKQEYQSRKEHQKILTQHKYGSDQRYKAINLKPIDRYAQNKTI